MKSLKDGNFVATLYKSSIRVNDSWLVINEYDPITAEPFGKGQAMSKWQANKAHQVAQKFAQQLKLNS